MKLVTSVKVGAVALALGSFAISYEQLHSVALAAGIPAYLAVVYGAITEGFTTIATVAAYLTRGTREARYPWAVTIAAFSFSLWANAAPETVPPGIARSVIVIAIPVAVHLYVVVERATQAATGALDGSSVGSDNHRTIPGAGPLDEIAATPHVITDIDPTIVKNPELIAARLMAHAADTASSRSYWERKARTLSTATVTA